MQMYESIAYLRGQETVSYDKYGNEIIELGKRKVYVKPLTVYSSEFYQAAQAGMHPSITFELSNRKEYQGEQLILFENRNFKVVRVDWSGDQDKIRLICEEQIGLESEDESE